MNLNFATIDSKLIYPTRWAEILVDLLSLITVADRLVISIAVVLELWSLFLTHRRGQERCDVFILSSNSSTPPLRFRTCRWVICSMSTLFYWSDANVCQASLLFPSLHLSIPHSSTTPQPATTGMGLLLPNHVPVGVGGQRGQREGGGKCVNVRRGSPLMEVPLICEDQTKDHSLYPFLAYFPHFEPQNKC